MFSLFRMRSIDDMLKLQLEDAERDLVMYEARREEFEAHICMLRSRMSRIRLQQEHREANRWPKPPPQPLKKDNHQ